MSVYQTSGYSMGNHSLQSRLTSGISVGFKNLSWSSGELIKGGTLDNVQEFGKFCSTDISDANPLISMEWSTSVFLNTEAVLSWLDGFPNKGAEEFEYVFTVLFTPDFGRYCILADWLFPLCSSNESWQQFEFSLIFFSRGKATNDAKRDEDMLLQLQFPSQRLVMSAKSRKQFVNHYKYSIISISEKLGIQTILTRRLMLYLGFYHLTQTFHNYSFACTDEYLSSFQSC